MASLRGRVIPAREAAETGAVGWAELHARFSAAHAAAAQLAADGQGASAILGGFENWNAAHSAGNNPSRAVNPTDLADGKSAEGMEATIAGETMAGGRGR